MAKRVQFRRGTTTQHSVFIGAPGEITVDTTKNIIVVHDGITPGGWPADRLSDVQGNITLSGVATFTNATPSTSTTTGAIIVTGGVGVGGRITANNSVITATTASTSTSTGALTVAGGLGVAGRITTTDLVETSSITLKENINPLQNALDVILKLQGMIYDRKDGSSKNEAGLIAEQVNEIAPNLVTKDENGNVLGLRYTKLITYLVESIKDQQKQIEDLKQRIRDGLSS